MEKEAERSNSNTENQALESFDTFEISRKTVKTGKHIY